MRDKYKIFMSEKYNSHYAYLERIIPSFFKKVGLNWEDNKGIIVAHGDKCYGYKSKWEKAGIPFHKGVAIYLLTYCRPFSLEVRQTWTGWVAPEDWVIDNFSRFSKFLKD